MGAPPVSEGAVQTTARVPSPRAMLVIEGAAGATEVGSSASAFDQGPYPDELWARIWNSYFTPPSRPVIV